MASNPMAQDIIRCDICTEGTFTGITPAEVVCKTCNINLCKVCMAEHISSQLSVKHDILGIHFHSTHIDIILPTCQIHPKYKCELNCQDCSVPVCLKCIAGPHKKHDVGEISEIFKSQKQIMEKDNEELEKTILPTYEKIDSDYEEEIFNVAGEYDNFRRAVTKEREDWLKIVDTIVRKRLQKAETMEKDHVAILRRDQSEIRKIQTTARNIFQTNKESLQSNDTKRMINYKSRNNELKKVTAKTKLSPPSFSPSKISEEILNEMFGEIKPSIKTEVAAYNIRGQGEVISPPVKQFFDYQRTTEINSGFAVPWRVCCIPDTEELYVRGSSKTIKHLDNKGKVLNEIMTKSGNTPQHLSVIRNGSLVYSDLPDRSINIVNNGMIDTMNSLQGWKPWAVCSTSTDDLLVTMKSDDFNNSKVVRYAGSTINQEIQFDHQGKALYFNPEYITENRNLDICVSDTSACSLIVVDRAGQLMFKYVGKHKMQKSRKFNPCGLAIDSQCHILVSDNNNNCIHILNDDGGFIRYIDKCNLDRPLDLSISSEDVLYVVDYMKKLKVITYLH